MEVKLTVAVISFLILYDITLTIYQALDYTKKTHKEMHGNTSLRE